MKPLLWQYQDFRFFIDQDRNAFQIIQEKKNELGLKGWEIYEVHRAKSDGKPAILYLVMAKRPLGYDLKVSVTQKISTTAV
jgi:hypothetical protein